MSNPSETPEQIERIINSPSYRLAFEDFDFLAADESRGIRLGLETEKPERAFRDMQIESTIVCFGATRVVERKEALRRQAIIMGRLQDHPDDVRIKRQAVQANNIVELSKYYDMARQFAQLVSKENMYTQPRQYMICTGGGPGIMEAANRGAADVGAQSIGLNISLPMEQVPNPYITPELCFQFHYFSVRKLHFLMRARGLVVFPGGFGTLDELFDAVTLRQTGKMQNIPIILFGWEDYWSKIIDFQAIIDMGTAADADMDIIQFANSPEEAWTKIKLFHGEVRESDLKSST